MFNSLQEAIMVIDVQEKTGSERREFDIFFANEMMQKLMNKVLDVPEEK